MASASRSGAETRPHRLDGRRVAILAALGVEQVELTRPRQAVTDAGGSTDLLSIEAEGTHAVHDEGATAPA